MTSLTSSIIPSSKDASKEHETLLSTARSDASQIFQSAINAALPQNAIENSMKFLPETNELHIQNKIFNMKNYDSIRIIGFGKASSEMASAVRKIVLPLKTKNISIEKRTARYHCTIVYLEKPAQSNPIICQGSWEGIIADVSFGTGGFGYDPLFIVKDFGLRASELRPAEKNKISHRGQAMAKLMDALSSRRMCPE